MADSDQKLLDLLEITNERIYELGKALEKEVDARRRLAAHIVSVTDALKTSVVATIAADFYAGGTQQATTVEPTLKDIGLHRDTDHPSPAHDQQHDHMVTDWMKDVQQRLDATDVIRQTMQAEINELKRTQEKLDKETDALDFRIETMEDNQ
jgi:hypothetical protein